MNRREFLATIGAAAAASSAAPALARSLAEHAARSGVDPQRIARLARGVNLSHWMWFPHAQGERARRAFITRADLDQLKAAGFTHARLPFEPSWLWDDAARSLRPAEFAEYRDAVRLCLAADLAVVVDAHWSRTPWIRPRGGDFDDRFGELDRMWASLATRLTDTDPDRVFLELVNEPHDLRDPEHWHDAQRRIAESVRAAAPRHTIVATGADWGGIDGLLRLEPLDDPNVVYSFHFYGPHNFTHQAAEWGFPPWKDIHGVPWPADREELERTADTFPQESRNALRWSARAGTEDPWNADALRDSLRRAADWSGRHDRPVYCGEFGVYTKASPRDSRLAWHRAVADALREHRIGWALWDYVGGFRIATGGPNARTLDEELLASLNLGNKAPPPDSPPG